jgi:hypothetical protein
MEGRSKAHVSACRRRRREGRRVGERGEVAAERGSKGRKRLDGDTKLFPSVIEARGSSGESPGLNCGRRRRVNREMKVGSAEKRTSAHRRGSERFHTCPFTVIVTYGVNCASSWLSGILPPLIALSDETRHRRARDTRGRRASLRGSCCRLLVAAEREAARGARTRDGLGSEQR